MHFLIGPLDTALSTRSLLLSSDVHLNAENAICRFCAKANKAHTTMGGQQFPAGGCSQHHTLSCQPTPMLQGLQTAAWWSMQHCRTRACTSTGSTCRLWLLYHPRCAPALLDHVHCPGCAHDALVQAALQQSAYKALQDKSLYMCAIASSLNMSLLLHWQAVCNPSVYTPAPSAIQFLGRLSGSVLCKITPARES